MIRMPSGAGLHALIGLVRCCAAKRGPPVPQLGTLGFGQHTGPPLGPPRSVRWAGIRRPCWPAWVRQRLRPFRSHFRRRGITASGMGQ